jgi:hypothetical protein
LNPAYTRNGNPSGEENLQIRHELVCRNSGLPQDASQGTNCQFVMQGHNATHIAFRRLLLEHDMATTLGRKSAYHSMSSLKRETPVFTAGWPVFEW